MADGEQTQQDVVVKCAACNVLHTECNAQCFWRPIYPPHHEERFTLVHKTYGLPGLRRKLSQVEDQDRRIAWSQTLYWTAAALAGPPPLMNIPAIPPQVPKFNPMHGFNPVPGFNPGYNGFNAPPNHGPQANNNNAHGFTENAGNQNDVPQDAGHQNAAWFGEGASNQNLALDHGWELVLIFFPFLFLYLKTKRALNGIKSTNYKTYLF